MHRSRRPFSRLIAASCLVLAGLVGSGPATVNADHGGPHLLDPNLRVRTVIAGLDRPATMTFMGADILVSQKASGTVHRIVNGQIGPTVLDLPVNSASERGLLGITLDPGWPAEPYLYAYWTQSLSGVDSTITADVPLLGNRVDRFRWNGTSFVPDLNLVQLRARQNDAGQPERGNHNGGVITFGSDGKLYIQMGDNGRRGFTQNLPCGPTATCPGPIVQDDQYGGPQPDNAHLTGVILRLNRDGTTPADNPLTPPAGLSAEAAANVRKIFAYGIRNGFGMAVDPVSGDLWEQENGDDTFSELNRVEPGMNSGWIQLMGPAARLPQYRQIEVTEFGGALQQNRWPPTNIATTSAEALARMYVLPGSHFSDPEMAWKYEVAPGGIGFVEGRGLGPQYEGDLFMGGARDFLMGGHLFHFNLTGNRRAVGVDDPRLDDRVADNTFKFDIAESESLLIGTNFGVVTDIETGPNGNLFLVTMGSGAPGVGAIYEISRR